MYTVDDPRFLLALLILLFLSIITIEYCSRTHQKFRSPDDHLFHGASRLHSFASYIGSLFSVTYFFGATVIYGNIFGTWLLLACLLVLVISWLLIRRILILAVRTAPSAQSGLPKNILLDLFKSRLPQVDFNGIARLYLVIYFGLLVEELAVARLLLTSLFPDLPALVAAILGTIVLCVALYLYVGGFRAVLQSDLVQLALLAPFLCIMLVLILKSDGDTEILKFSLEMEPTVAIVALVFSSWFGVAWFVSSVDIFARFNFEVSGRPLLADRLQLARLAFLGLAVLLVIGAVFGRHVDSFMPSIETPMAYFEASTSYFIQGESELIAVITLLSLYSMIFTTVDALLLNLLQVGRYRESALWSRGGILRILVAAVFLSCPLPLNSLGAVGIFFGALLLLPFMALIKILWPRANWLFPQRLQYLSVAAVIASLVLMVKFEFFSLPFEHQLLIPGMILGVTFACQLGALLLERLTRMRHR